MEGRKPYPANQWKGWKHGRHRRPLASENGMSIESYTTRSRNRTRTWSESYLNGQLLEAIYIIKDPALHAAGCVGAWAGVGQRAPQDPRIWVSSVDERVSYRRSRCQPPPRHLMLFVLRGRKGCCFKGRLADFPFFLNFYILFLFCGGSIFFIFTLTLTSYTDFPFSFLFFFIRDLKL